MSRSHRPTQDDEECIFAAATVGDWKTVSLSLSRISSDFHPKILSQLLHLAVEQKDLEKVKRLLAHNPRVNIEKNKKTPIQLAVELECWDCVTAIARAVKTDANDTARYGSALVNAAEKNQTEAALALVAAGADSGWHHVSGDHAGYFAVHFAIDNNNLSLLEAILKKHGAAAARSQYESYITPLSLALFKNNAQAVTLLLAHGAKVNGRAIIEAAENKNWEFVWL